MAQAYSRSSFAGYDYHAPSIELARKSASDAGLNSRVRFDTASATAFPGTGFDLICLFDCLHDMGDPVAAASHIRRALADDGTLMLVEPYAGDALEENLTPVGRAFYGFSTVVCTPASLAQPGAFGLGAQAGEERLTGVLRQAGFSRVRRATDTPFNLVIEARP
ncbi:MAG TPA: class I SAM-dependent methyltransferase [Streptosporangiaceae bacterium]